MKLEKNHVTHAVVTATPTNKAGTVADNAPEKAQKSAPAPAPAKSTQGVPVTMSRLASNMVQSVQVSAADVDQKKVDAVRSAIEKKTFKVNAEAVADKMLANAQEMLQQKPQGTD
jgi:negative regulator of flagellin synthesis FlgM